MNPQKEPIERFLNSAEGRILEVWSAIEMAGQITDGRSANLMLGLSDLMRKGGWITLNNALQTTIITGLASLAEPNAPENASVPTLLSRVGSMKLDANDRESALAWVRATKPGVSEIYERYGTERHKMFGHNDHRRLEYIQVFNGRSFTKEQYARDVEFLERCVRVVRRLAEGLPVLKDGEAGLEALAMRFRPKIREDIAALLSDIAKGLPPRPEEQS